MSCYHPNFVWLFTLALEQVKGASAVVAVPPQNTVKFCVYRLIFIKCFGTKAEKPFQNGDALIGEQIPPN